MGKLANCTKIPVQPELAMRGEGAMRADKAECAAGRPERCGAMVVDKGREKGNGSETGARCANGEESTASDGERGQGA
jgi:hypothetical protein